jgi:D-hydroxyproline dehydrogenase subunit beta
MNSKTWDVVIVGGGIVGAACAYECANRGLNVALVEREIVGGGATAAGMGHIVVMDDSEAQFALTRYSQELWQQLRPELPADVEYEQCGTIWVAADDDEMAEVSRKQAFYSAHGVPVQVLNADQLEDCEPHLRKGLAGGLLVAEDAVMYPPCAARFLVEQAMAKGAKLLAGRTVTAIGGGQVSTDREQLSCDVIVNAAGAWASELMPRLEIKRRKGHLLITDRYPGYVRHQLVELGYLKKAHSVSEDSVAFNVQPRKTGQVLIGSSRQFGAEHKEVDSYVLARMLKRAREYMPELAGMSTIRAWTGFRAATPDNLPLIGPWPADNTILVCTGHEGLGITTSLASGKLVADQIAGRTPAIPAQAYLPSRMLAEHVHA